MNFNQYELYKVERREHERKAERRRLAVSIIAQQKARVLILSVLMLVIVTSTMVLYIMTRT